MRVKSSRNEAFNKRARSVAIGAKSELVLTRTKKGLEKNQNEVARTKKGLESAWRDYKRAIMFASDRAG